MEFDRKFLICLEISLWNRGVWWPFLRTSVKTILTPKGLSTSTDVIRRFSKQESFKEILSRCAWIWTKKSHCQNGATWCLSKRLTENKPINLSVQGKQQNHIIIQNKYYPPSVHKSKWIITAHKQILIFSIFSTVSFHAT